ncbi:hypothetical protein U9M48_030440 [Paspalum notatum var. saurae]|uniref:Integrase zinc-binding domain-containing protein n=1 Tax=Paspalum notatum var. saurae TaxID=547442 RepID=A0AAQ3U320_PASNO
MALGFQMPHELRVEFERLSLKIREHQKNDEKLQKIRELLKIDKAPHFRKDKQICVPNVDNIRKLILSEANDTAYSIHPGSTKIYYDLKKRFWWYGMKRAVAEYVAICDTCQRVKAEHQRPTGLLQPLKVPEWKWKEITMDFCGFASYQASLNKSPFEALYGNRCRMPLFWNQTGEKQVFGPDIIQDAEQQLRIVQKNLRVAQSRQRSYADVHRTDL